MLVAFCVNDLLSADHLLTAMVHTCRDGRGGVVGACR